MNDKYESLTRDKYKDTNVAKAYRAQHQDSNTWAKFTMTRELSFVDKGLSYYTTSKKDYLLDIPCGTGVAGSILSKHQSNVIAADISYEMMLEASEEYNPVSFTGFVQSDITKIPLDDSFVRGSIVLGFMHRVPDHVKKDAMDELYRVSQDFSIVSFTVDSFAYRLKKTLLRIVKPGHSNAPAPMRIDSIRNLIVSAVFNVDNELMVAPFLSGETVFWLSSNKSKRG